jgi:hypothetical protein
VLKVKGDEAFAPTPRRNYYRRQLAPLPALLREELSQLEITSGIGPRAHESFKVMNVGREVYSDLGIGANVARFTTPGSSRRATDDS